MSTESLAAIEAAVQAHSNALSDTEEQSGPVRAIVVVGEEQRLDDQGEPEFDELYAVCGVGNTPVTTAGLLDRGQSMVRQTLDSQHLVCYCDDEEDQ